MSCSEWLHYFFDIPCFTSVLRLHVWNSLVHRGMVAADWWCLCGGPAYGEYPSVGVEHRDGGVHLIAFQPRPTISQLLVLAVPTLFVASAAVVAAHIFGA